MLLYNKFKNKDCNIFTIMCGLTALISRYIEKNPNCTNNEIYDFLKKRAIQKGKKITKYGWIPDPLDNYLIN